MQHLFNLSSSSLPETHTKLLSFQGTETLGRPYEFEIFFAIQRDLLSDEVFEMADAVGANATLTASPNDGRAPFEFHGIFASIRHIHEVAGSALYRAVLVPRLWHLGQNRHSRIFTQKTIPEIITAVLEAGGLASDEFRLSLEKDYGKEEHVCQYRESDLSFLHRWMEHEGIYYYFEQIDGHETMVITDHSSVHEPLEGRPVPYFPLSGEDTSARECFDSFACERKARPSSVILADYDYLHPTHDMGRRHEVSPVGFGEVHTHGDRYFQARHGERLAQVRAEELSSREETFHASGTALYTRPGYTFTVEQHPFDGFNKSYVAVSVHHVGNQAAGSDYMRHFAHIKTNHVYRCSVSAIDSIVQYRSERSTSWPRVYANEIAFVDGPADSEYAQLDDEGRYHVRFSFDESGLKNGKASTRVRMLQPHAGSPEGFHFPLRKGTEVLITFLGGDPDRPVIAGAIPNKLTPSPVTKKNHTQNVIHTGSDNRFEIEDEKGKQRITITTPVATTRYQMGDGDWKTDFKADVSTSGQCHPHTIVEETEGSKYLYTGGDWDVRIATKHSEVVGDDVTQLYHGHKQETVDKTLVELYKDTKHETVIGALCEEYKSTKEETVDGDLNEHYKATKTETVDGALTENYNCTKDETVLGALTEMYSATKSETVVGALTETYNASQTTTVNVGRTTTIVGNDTLTITANEIKTTVGANMDNYIGAKVETFVGAKLSLSLAAAAELFVGLKAETFIGAKFSANISAEATLNVGPRTELWAVKQETAPINIVMVNISTQIHTTTIVNAALHLHL